ncbi:hypothetical protein DFH09DRAFT_1082318 [Mycena vulgaris]|nr:hypothetical protein DFH09DRAFT_1082318 [Mycena vulgaris]
MCAEVERFGDEQRNANAARTESWVGYERYEGCRSSSAGRVRLQTGENVARIINIRGASANAGRLGISLEVTRRETNNESGEGDRAIRAHERANAGYESAIGRRMAGHPRGIRVRDERRGEGDSRGGNQAEKREGFKEGRKQLGCN